MTTKLYYFLKLQIMVLPVIEIISVFTRFYIYIYIFREFGEWHHGYEEYCKSKGVPWCELQRKESGRKVMVAYISQEDGPCSCTVCVYSTHQALASGRAPRDGLFLLFFSSSPVLNNNTSSFYPRSFCFRFLWGYSFLLSYYLFQELNII